MKITIVQGAFLPVPPKRGGAVEKVWLGLGREFARQGHEVVHISRLCDGLSADEVVDGVRHRRVRGSDTPNSLLVLKWRDLLYTRRVAKILPRSDIVVTNTFWAPMVFKPERHGHLWVHVQRYPKGQMKHYRRATRLQTVSGVIAKAIKTQAPDLAKRVMVIPNPLPGIDGAMKPVTRDPNLVLYVGRIHPEKGIDLLIQAMIVLRQQRPEARLRIVGPWEAKYGGGGAEYGQKLRVHAAPLGRSVEFTGAVFSETELAAHYEEAAAFVYPSLAAKGEASPVAPLEALSHGLPVVVSDLECFDDTLPKNTIYAHRFNHEALTAPARLAGILERILTQTENWPEVSAAARARAAEFSMERIAQKYLEGFNTVLGKK